MLDPAFSPALTEYEVYCNLSNESVTVTPRKASDQATWGKQANYGYLWSGKAIVNGVTRNYLTPKGTHYPDGSYIEPEQFDATIALDEGMTEAWMYFSLYYDGGTQTYTVHIIVNNI